MSGENESPQKTIKEQLDEVNKVLDQYEQSCGLPARLVPLSSEATDLVQINRETIRGMSAEDCNEAALVITQYAFHIQRALNYHLAIVVWAKDTTKRLIAPRLNQQQGYGYEEKSLLAIRENDAATQANHLRMKAEVYVARLSFLPSKLESYARYFSDMAQTKRKQHG